MWSYSTCAKQYQKYNVLTDFFIGIKELCTALADNPWLTANPEESFDKLRLDALFIPNYVIKKGPTHGARHGKTEVQREYHLAWNAWKRCCKKVDSQGEHFTGLHDRFLRDPIFMNHNSQSDRQNRSAKSGMDLQKKTIHIISLQRKRKDTKDNGILL